MYVYIYINICIYVYIYIYIYICVCVCVCVYVYTHILKRIFIFMHLALGYLRRAAIHVVPPHDAVKNI